MTHRRAYALMAAAAMVASTLCAAEPASPPAAGTDLASSQLFAPTAPAADTNRTQRPLFVTTPPQFETLKRAPVMFWHDKHTAALKAEGCEACHPKKDGRLEFSFPAKPAEGGRTALMDAYHAACMGCHTEFANKGKKTGPVNCGDCHSEKKAYHEKEFLPLSPEYYEALRDPYHKECIACHGKQVKPAEHSPDLDWKGFYVKEKRRIELEWPEIVYDYAIHDKHTTALEKKCELCHYLSPDLKQKLAAEGKEPTSQDWLREEEKGQSLKVRESAHRRCLNCHLERIAQKQPKAGPVECKDCHVDHLRSPKEMEGIPPPDYGKKDRILIQAEKATFAAVPFDHKSHIARSRSCDDCHHDTLESCKTCHTLKGAKEGNFITLAQAYHDSGSTWSCAGCHEKEKQKPDCAGCHHLRKDGLAATTCDACHTGKLESLDQAARLPDPATLFPTNLTDELTISILEKEYDASKVKHRDIVKKLTDISNASKLATFFHKKETTMCAGCHHMGTVEKNKPVPACSACHTVQNKPLDETPTLLGAYHQQCLGCHKEMGHPEEKMPQECAGCHKERKMQP